ncbi:hypothetical protein [Sphingomonas sp. PB4P5]
MVLARGESHDSRPLYARGRGRTNVDNVEAIARFDRWRGEAWTRHAGTVA